MWKLRGRLLLTLLMLVMIAGVVLFRSMPLPSGEVDYRTLWDERGSTHYRIIVDSRSLPQPYVGLELTIQNGEVIERSIIACDNPSEDYPEWACEPVRTYYVEWGTHTIEELFTYADSCVRSTQAIISQCPAYSSGGFSSFSTVDEMYEAADTCEDYLPISDSLCTVTHDPYYGYPREIFYYRYGADIHHPVSTIEVKEFEIIEE
jgi:hypothetical protein